MQLDDRLKWAGNTGALYRKGQSRLYGPLRLRGFNVCNKCVTARDVSKLNKLVRKAGSVTGGGVGGGHQTGVTGVEGEEAEVSLESFTGLFIKNEKCINSNVTFGTVKYMHLTEICTFVRMHVLRGTYFKNVSGKVPGSIPYLHVTMMSQSHGLSEVISTCETSSFQFDQHCFFG